MDKRGQFFLIATLIIVAIVLTLNLVYNEIKSPKEDATIYDLSEEIIFEGSLVLARGIYHASTESEISKDIEILASNYSLLNPDSDIIILYGNSNSIDYLVYKNIISGSISIPDLDSSTKIEGIQRKIGKETPINNKVEIELKDTMGEIKYTFNLKKGENFYIIVQKEREGEKTIVQK